MKLFVTGLACAWLVGAVHADKLQLTNGTQRDGRVASYSGMVFEFVDQNGATTKPALATIRRIDFDGTTATVQTRTQGELKGTLVRFENAAFTLKTEDGKEQQLPVMLIKGMTIAGGDSGKPVEIIAHGERVKLEDHLVAGKVTIVDFFADWCGPCRSIGPYLEKLARQDQDVVLRKVDIVKWGTPVTEQYQINSIPHIRVYDRHGHLVDTVRGASAEAVQAAVDKAKKS